MWHREWEEVVIIFPSLWARLHSCRCVCHYERHCSSSEWKGLLTFQHYHFSLVLPSLNHLCASDESLQIKPKESRSRPTLPRKDIYIIGRKSVSDVLRSWRALCGSLMFQWSWGRMRRAVKAKGCVSLVLGWCLSRAAAKVSVQHSG